jgi:hypothetical protein
LGLLKSAHARPVWFGRAIATILANAKRVGWIEPEAKSTFRGCGAMVDFASLYPPYGRLSYFGRNDAVRDVGLAA